MAKLLKVLVVLLLILSAVALVIEIVLIRQREEIKGRNTMLTRGALQVARTLEVIPAETNLDLVTRDLPRLQLNDEMFKHFYQLGADGKTIVENGKKKTEGPGTLDSVLKEISTRAELQFVRLNDTRSGLESTRTTLGVTSNTLVSTVQDLSQTQDKLKETETNLGQAKQDITQKAEQITDLTQKTEALTADVERKKEEVAKLGDKLSDTEAKIEATKRYIEKLQKDLESCLRGPSEGQIPGLQGQVVVVNTNWNFVVIDVLPEAKLVPLTELRVQREDKLVGKVRVSEVLRDRHFAFGEILPDWQQLPIAKGDNVFY
jgi:hypothetical protein